MLSRPAVFALFYTSGIAGLVYQVLEYHHWLPRPEDQPPLNLSSLKGSIAPYVQ